MFVCLIAQSGPTLCEPMNCSLPGSSIHGDSPGKNIGVGCHSLLQGIFPTQGWNPGLLHCRQILYHLSHQGSPLNAWLWKKKKKKDFRWRHPSKFHLEYYESENSGYYLQDEENQGLLWMVQLLRIHLAVQGMWVPFLVGNDAPPCCRETKPVCHKYWSPRTPHPTCHD